jgi:tRNA pseudouridine-54 N-methylase
MYTPSHQMRALSGYLRRMEATIANAFLAMRRALDADLDKSVERVRSGIAEGDRELREGLLYVLAESARDRWIGVGFLGIGIVLTTLGSVV